MPKFATYFIIACLIAFVITNPLVAGALLRSAVEAIFSFVQGLSGGGSV